jgi:Protein of unknown function (DUF4242)
MARVIVEQVFAEPMTDERYSAFAKKIDPCMEIRHGLWRRSSLSTDKLRLTCEFEAPDAGSVRDAFRSAGIEFVRVWTAEVFAVEDYPDMMKKLTALLEENAKGG